MSKKTNDAFEQVAAEVPNFTRDLFETLDEMKNYNEILLPSVFVSSVKETGRTYIYRKNAEPTQLLGKWREISNQYTVMPEPNESNKDDVYQFIGESNDDFTKGIFYKVNKTESGVTNSETYYAYASENGDKYFIQEESLEDFKEYPCFILQEEKMVITDSIIVYDGNQITLDWINALTRAPESDETIETPIYNYSWKALTSGGSSSGGASTASEVSYKNENYPSQTNVKKALDAIWAKLDYVKPEILSFTMTPSTTIYEVGSSVDSLNFVWTLNKDVTTQTLTDCTITVDDRSATYSTPITSNKTFTLTVGDGENSVSKNLSVSFQNKIYWGNAAIPAEFNSDFVLGLQNSKFTTTKKGNYSMNIEADEYGFIAFPSSFGTLASWYIGGFETTVESCGEISFTNTSGGVTNYSIYRTGRSGLGNITAEIK